MLFNLIKRGENHSPWALNFFKSSPAVETPLATIPPPSLPPVPLTPLPEAVISGGSVSPAWDPSSRTPPGHVSEHQEPSDGDVPLHRQIPKPKGKLNRSKGYNLKQSLLWDEPLYTEIKVKFYVHCDMWEFISGSPCRIISANWPSTILTLGGPLANKNRVIVNSCSQRYSISRTWFKTSTHSCS